MEATIEQKQQYLAKQILDCGFDGQSFMQFIGEIKNEKQSISLQNWSMEELKNVVKLYKGQTQVTKSREHKQKQGIADLSKQLIKSIIQDNKKQPSSQKTIVHYGREMLWDYQFKSQQNCKRFLNKIDLTKNPKVSCILFTTKKDGGYIFGLGSKNQFWMTLVTNFTQQKVERKNQDFQWLRKALIIQTIGFYVPPLEQISHFQPQDKAMQQKRVKVIMNFMNNLLNFDYLAQNQLVWKFLTIIDYSKFSKLKSQFKNKIQNKQITNIQTLEGKLQFQISKRMINLINKSSKFTQKTKEKYESLSNNILKVLNDIQALTKHTLYVTKDFLQLNEFFNQISGEKSIIQDKSLSTTFLYVQNLLMQFNKFTKSHLQIIKQFMIDCIKPLQQQWKQFSKFQKNRNQKLNQYLNNKLNLIKKKEKYFQDPLKWQLTKQQYDKLKKVKFNIKKQQAFLIMFQKENQLEKEMKIWQGLLNYMYEKSFNLLIRNQQRRYNKCLSKYIEINQKINYQKKICLQNFKQVITNFK